MTERGIVTFPGFESAGQYERPKVVSATALDETTVRVVYDQPMKRSNPAESDDALNPDNYTFVVTGGVSVNAVSCAVHTPAEIDITLSGEMTAASSIEVTVANVISSVDQLIDPGYNSTVFSGFGYKPQVSSATALDGVIVEVLFNEAMSTSGLTTPGNYTFIPAGGADPLTAYQVDIIASNKVWVWTTTPQTVGGDYTIVVSGVKDLADNPIDDPPNDRADFVGVEITTKLTDVEVISDTKIRLQFSKPMLKDADLQNTDNYILTPVTPGAAPLYINQLSFPAVTYPEYVDVVISEMTNGKTYNCEVSTDLKDRWSNNVSEFFKDDDFVGQGTAPFVRSVVASSPTKAIVYFNELMKDNADIRNPAKYSFNLGLSVLAVLDVEGEMVTLVTGEQTPGIAYELTVTP